MFLQIVFLGFMLFLIPEFQHKKKTADNVDGLNFIGWMMGFLSLRFELSQQFDEQLWNLRHALRGFHEGNPELGGSWIH